MAVRATELQPVLSGRVCVRVSIAHRVRAPMHLGIWHLKKLPAIEPFCGSLRLKVCAVNTTGQLNFKAISNPRRT
jgi:hypothetical protein